jgi:hypothetical protein
LEVRKEPEVPPLDLDNEDTISRMNYNKISLPFAEDRAAPRNIQITFRFEPGIAVEDHRLFWKLGAQRLRNYALRLECYFRGV